jgi:predicted metal-binding membrane protein
MARIASAAAGALTALLFAGGVMNMLWIAVLALIILLKKIIPVGSLLARLVGIGLVAEGVWLLSV